MSAVLAEPLDARHQIGANLPPNLRTFETHRIHIDGLLTEARNFCDGEPVETEGQAQAVSRLMDDLRKAGKAADEARVSEKRPFDDAVKEIQDRWNPLIQNDRGKVDLAIGSCKAALAPYLKRLDDEKRAQAEAARKAAEEAAERAAEAVRQAQAADLSSREAAEDLIEAAKQAEADAKRAATARAQATGGERATTLRSYWTPVLTDPGAALTYYAQTRPDDLMAMLLQFAEEDVRAGKRSLPGFEIREDRRVV